MAMVVKQLYRVKGDVFGVRGCPSGCNCSPCDCDPCTCGEDEKVPNTPLWRVSGCAIASGEIQGESVSGLLVLSLALPLQQESVEHWQEVLLLDERATPQQRDKLLKVFEPRLKSMPAEVVAPPKLPRAVYTAPTEYVPGEETATLRVTFTRDRAVLYRAGADHTVPKEWSYDGLVALRGRFEWQH